MVSKTEMEKWVSDVAKRQSYSIISDYNSDYNEEHGIAAMTYQIEYAIGCIQTRLLVFRETADRFKGVVLHDTMNSRRDYRVDKIEIVTVSDPSVSLAITGKRQNRPGISDNFEDCESVKLARLYSSLENKVMDLVRELTVNFHCTNEWGRGIDQFVRVEGNDNAFVAVFESYGQYGAHDIGFKVWEEDGELKYEEIDLSPAEGTCFFIKSAEFVDGVIRLHMGNVLQY